MDPPSDQQRAPGAKEPPSYRAEEEFEPTMLVVCQPAMPPLPPGRIAHFRDTLLGKGSYGTAVRKGSFEGRTVAVKRTILDFVTLISRDVNTLQAAGGHPNVMQYYHHETDSDCLYIAFELCPATLADVFDRPDEFRDAVDVLALEPKATLRQITAGLHHLHTLDIIHRDVKPQNILMAPVDENTQAGPGLRWLLSDFGLRKKYEYNRKCLRFPTSRAWIQAHTLGWRAPELIPEELECDDPEAPPEFPEGDDRNLRAGVAPTVTGWLTKAVDIFALGCLYYCVLTRGRLHAFGGLYVRERNILKNAPELEGLEELGDEGEEALTLIKRMLSPDPDTRPDSVTCEEGDFEVLGPDRYSRLDELFIEHLDEFRKYDGKSVQDVFNALRVSDAKTM